MRKPPKPIFTVVFIFLVFGLPAACGEDGAVGEALPLADTSAASGEPSASLHYQYTVDVSILNVYEDEVIPLLILVDEANPTIEAIVTGNAEGIQTTNIAGQNEGQLCWVTIEHKINYFVSGFFYPKECSFEITITTTILDSTVVKDECGGTITLSTPSAFYHAPPVGPHTFTNSLDPIVENIDDGVKAIITFSNVWVPTSTGCGW